MPAALCCTDVRLRRHQLVRTEGLLSGCPDGGWSGTDGVGGASEDCAEVEKIDFFSGRGKLASVVFELDLKVDLYGGWGCFHLDRFELSAE